MSKLSSPFFVAQNLCKSFKKGQDKLSILKNVSLALSAGEIAALVGPSGAGKSTLLQVLGLLDRPDSGEIRMDNRNAGCLSDAERTMLRRQHIGFVYQSHRLLPEFTALENAIIPLWIAGKSMQESLKEGENLLDQVGLSRRLHHFPSQLSGGEQQRIAIVRALIHKPKIILADEPTGNLDSHTAEAVFKLFLDLIRSTGASALIATHNPDLASRMDKTLTLVDGVLT